MEEALNKEIKNLLKVNFQFKNLHGGQFCQTYKLELEDGTVLFCKLSEASTGMFYCEHNGLLELGKSDIRVPIVLFSTDRFLIMEFIGPGQLSSNTFYNFGRNLGGIHKISAEKFGYKENNYIGKSPQINELSTSWLNFYYKNRLLFQFKLAEARGLIDKGLALNFSRLEKKLHKIINEDERPSLLHGDLWSGNFVIDEKSNACLIDPAIYFGNREAEFGMITLFGGFNKDFYVGYNEIFPLKEDWENRNKIYQLYHLLNHLNLFGKSYLKKVQENINFYL